MAATPSSSSSSPSSTNEQQYQTTLDRRLQLFHDTRRAFVARQIPNSYKNGVALDVTARWSNLGSDKPSDASSTIDFAVFVIETIGGCGDMDKIYTSTSDGSESFSVHDGVGEVCHRGRGKIFKASAESKLIVLFNVNRDACVEAYQKGNLVFDWSLLHYLEKAVEFTIGGARHTHQWTKPLSWTTSHTECPMM
jgi:hypothetical protein